MEPKAIPEAKQAKMAEPCPCCGKPKKLRKFADVADRLGITVEAFREMCRQGRGPKFIKLNSRDGRISPKDEEEWLERLTVTNLAEARSLEK